jgi:hypothetical protein
VVQFPLEKEKPITLAKKLVESKPKDVKEKSRKDVLSKTRK